LGQPGSGRGKIPTIAASLTLNLTYRFIH